MGIQSSDLLFISDQLVDLTDCMEVHHRTAINRAYYSAYHEARLTADFLELPIVRTNAGEHERLVSRLQAGGKRLKTIASRIAAMKKIRAEADYKLNQSFSLLEAKKHIESCKRIVSELASLREPKTASK